MTHYELASMHVWICKTRLVKEVSKHNREFLAQFLERLWEHAEKALIEAGAPG
jgi:hypothetical protein